MALCDICGEPDATVPAILEGYDQVEVHQECFDYQDENHDKFPNVVAAIQERNE